MCLVTHPLCYLLLAHVAHIEGGLRREEESSNSQSLQHVHTHLASSHCRKRM